MKIVRIFAPHLWVFKLAPGLKDELTQLYEFWTDQVELRNYFTKNDSVLKYYKINIEVAIDFTIDFADSIYDYLDENQNNLDKIFSPLSDGQYSYLTLPPTKHKDKWIRLYAIKVETNIYVITGGAIKQSQKMKDDDLTQVEKEKIEHCRNFLQANGVFDTDSLIDFVNSDQ